MTRQQLPSWAQATRRTGRDQAAYYCPDCETSHPAPADGEGGRDTMCTEKDE